jgi:carbonic anhydrase
MVVTIRVVRDNLENKDIELHGWWFDIANADVYSFSAKKGEFVILDDKKAQELLVRFNIEHEKEPSNNAWPYWVPHKL